ncbi:hypothetical protein GJV26_15990 [Massilia dura]|uniref:Uncharacterized protein n=1 Tax=Pseudoduganella dura TaxID=321982 RepID=A0A6I3XHS4_9BURK|nr:hypothetical protein [Pseudoduganella dura]MUI13943.1 hypothetical protein [Pseudoduganella dura]GGX98932.1 hypothetical protein GCM10007386_32280 [Pseudoduganella dura]
MRLSAYPGHPDYKREWLPCHVFLNGELIEGCVHADYERCQVSVQVSTRDGDVVLDENHYIATKFLTGRVEFRRDWKHVNAVGFDAWMRDRIETAHQAFMKRTSA